MGRRKYLGLGSVLGAVSACLLLVYSGVGRSGEQTAGDAATILFPADHAVLSEGQFDLICKMDPASLKVDGKTGNWESCFESPIHVSSLDLPPGRHQLHIGSRQLEVFVSGSAGDHDRPEGWQVHRRHPLDEGSDRCGACHETKQSAGRITVGEPKPSTACFKCHNTVDFGVNHSHPLEPLEHCQTCHGLHDSPRKSLLKAPVKELCAPCHDT